MLRLFVIGVCTFAHVAAQQSGGWAPAPSPQFSQPARQPASGFAPSPSGFAPSPSGFAPASPGFAPSPARMSPSPSQFAPAGGSASRVVSPPGQAGGFAAAPGQAGFAGSAAGGSRQGQVGQASGVTPAPVPNGQWVMKTGCTCFCFNKQNLMDPPAWNASAGAPAKCTKPEPVYPNGDPTAQSPRGGSIFTDPVFLGGPALWDTDACMARPRGDPRQQDIKFFCTCCCPQQQPASPCPN